MRKIGTRYNHIIRSFKKTAHITLPVALFILGATVLYSAPPASKYEAGETLDPNCGPGDPNCSVTTGADLSAQDSDDLDEGATNLYYTEARVSNHVDVLANTGARHNPVTLSGANYLSLSGQALTAGEVDISSHTNLATGSGLFLTDDTLSVASLSSSNFASSNVSQWTNDANYVSDLSTFDATNLSIIDTGSYFTATTVEAALAELYASDTNAFSLLNKPSLSFVSGPAEDLDPTPAATNTTTGGGIEVTGYSFTPAENTTLYGVAHKTTTGTGYSIKARVWKQSGPEFIGETGYVTYSSGEYRAEFATPIVLEAGVTYRIAFAGSPYTIAVSTTATSYEGFTTLNGTAYYSSTGVDTYPSSTISGYWSPWTLIIAGEDLQKGVTGPLDPNDLANYQNATTNTFLRKTASGLEFTSIGVDQQVFSYNPLGSGVSEGTIYINPTQLGASGLVEWTAEAGWNLTSSTYGNPNFGDLDGDGDFDVAVGIDSGATLMYQNTGSVTAPVWTRNTVWETGIAGVGSRSVPALADLDGDGDLDLMIGTEVGTTLGYRNTGTSSLPQWTREATWDIADIGSRTNPELVDLDNDGDFDLLLGAQTTTGTTYGYENTGGTSSPTWVRNAGWDPPSVNFYASPTTGDLDGDGDFDLLIGAGNGNGLGYAYENIGSVAVPSWSAKSAWNLPDVGLWAYPELGDLDGDGDVDALIGDHETVVRAYKNTGSLGSVSNTLVGVAVDGTERFRINGSGDVFTAGDMHGTGFINSSTEEAKDNITFLSIERERNILNDIRTLDIANYRYLTDEEGEPLRLGLIAERSPREILSRDGRGVDLYKLSTFTLAGLKSLTEKVDGIESFLLVGGVSPDDSALGMESAERNPFVQALQRIGLTVNSGILSLKKLIGHEIQTEKLCIGETCVTESELIELLNNSGVRPNTNTDTDDGPIEKAEEESGNSGEEPIKDADSEAISEENQTEETLDTEDTPPTETVGGSESEAEEVAQAEEDEL